MAEFQPTGERPFFKPLPQHDTLNGAYLLWRISEEIEISPSGCWLWTGTTYGAGYGRIVASGSKFWGVHRLVYHLCVGDIPRGVGVLHECDTPRCCRPDHLFLGDQRKNMRDCAEKGRLGPKARRGEANGAARLTADQVRAIRRLYAEADGARGTITRLARKFKVGAQHISSIIHGDKWTHLSE